MPKKCDWVCLVACSLASGDLQWKVVQLPVALLLCSIQLHLPLGGEDEGHCRLAGEERRLGGVVATTHAGDQRGHGGHKSWTTF